MKELMLESLWRPPIPRGHLAVIPGLADMDSGVGGRDFEVTFPFKILKLDSGTVKIRLAKWDKSKIPAKSRHSEVPSSKIPKKEEKSPLSHAGSNWTMWISKETFGTLKRSVAFLVQVFWIWHARQICFDHGVCI